MGSLKQGSKGLNFFSGSEKGEGEDLITYRKNSIWGKNDLLSFLKEKWEKKRRENIVNIQQIAKVSEFYHFPNCSMHSHTDYFLYRSYLFGCNFFISSISNHYICDFLSKP